MAIGFVNAVIRCTRCRDLFGVSAAMGTGTIEKLPEPFEAECPHCGNRAIYPKSAIQIQVQAPAPGPR
jgi:predicted RNA-binding Zn-ribbon protein involved in translation (DUF1610 family)